MPHVHPGKAEVTLQARSGLLGNKSGIVAICCYTNERYVHLVTNPNTKRNCETSHIYCGEVEANVGFTWGRLLSVW